MENSRRPIFRQGVVDLGAETASLPNGLQVEMAVVRHPGAAAIVALDEARRVAMLHQYRHAVGGYLWEIPAGCREPGESAEQCARRELSEETGLHAADWKLLGSIVTIPSFCDEKITLFLATGLSTSDAAPEADEVLRLEWLELARLLAMIKSGEVIDAKTIAAIFHVAIELSLMLG